MEFSRDDKTRNAAAVGLAEQDGDSDFRAQFCAHHISPTPTVNEMRCCRTNVGKNQGTRKTAAGPGTF